MSDIADRETAPHVNGTVVPRELNVRQIDTHTDTRDILAHAKQQGLQRKYQDYCIVDIDTHHVESESWPEILEYLTDPVMKDFALSVTASSPPGIGLLPNGSGLDYQNLAGRIPHGQHLAETVDDRSVHRDITLARRAMECIGSDYMVIFPQPLLSLGKHPQPEVELALSFAYNRWFTDRILGGDPRLKGLIFLPFGNPDACCQMVEEFSEKPGVIGFTVTSQRNQAVHRNPYTRLYKMLEERKKPLCFHAGLNWGESLAVTDRFLSMHAISFVLCNIIHLTNWIVHGLPERFPNLDVIWIESGLAWLPFIMQRLDNEYLMRSSEAPLLKRRPSEYIREMYFSSQPMERTDMGLLESTFRAINAETQLMYASDWPHWDFDLPSTVFDLPFLSEQGRRNILGENACRLFNLPNVKRVAN